MASTWKYVRRLKSGRLEFRRAFPERLKDHLNRKEFIASLAARSMTERVAAERYGAALGTYQDLVARATKATAHNFDALSEPRIAWMVSTYEAAFLAEDDAARIAGTVAPDTHNAADDGFREVYAMRDMGQIRAQFAPDAVALGARQGWVFDDTSREFDQLCFELLEATIRANEIRMARDNGTPVPTPPTPPTPVEGATRPCVSKASFVALARAALERTVFGMSPTTIQATATALRLFEDLHGSLPPMAIHRVQVARFIDMLGRCPGKRPYNERGWSLMRLVEAYEGTNAARLSVKTIKQHVGMLSAIWNRLQNIGEIDEATPNPFARHRFPKVRRAEKGGFTVDELQAIFDLPLFTAGERPSRSKGEALFWAPLILLWIGARPEEVAQLILADLKQDGDAGEWTLTITDEGDHPRKGLRKLKAGNARRTFPVPRFLIERGLIEYRDWLMERGETALFPALGTRGKRKELFGGLTECWGAYLREHGAIADGKRPLREFRHNWTTDARRNRVPEEAREYIQGHSRAHRGQNTNYGDRETLGAEIHGVTFAQLDLTRVRRWEVP